MAKRPQREHDGPAGCREFNATSDVSQCAHGSKLPRSDDALPETLADYINILREWSLSGRSDSGLAPDATEQP